MRCSISYAPPATTITVALPESAQPSPRCPT